tara:strand:+ start:213 stop:860 length:648 start_codon:yes stop_codon:yes gene_type:complete
MNKKTIFTLIFHIYSAIAFRIAVAGAQGGLGRELIYQSIDKKLDTIALVRRPNDPIYEPFRNGWLDDKSSSKQVKITSAYLNVCDINKPIEKHFDALVMTLGEKPFTEDNSDIITLNLLKKLPKNCKKICLVSAQGVGDDKDANLGITAMRLAYLKNVYRAKEIQEKLVNNVNNKNNVKTLIIRPRVLSYGNIPFNKIAVPREKLANDILKWCLN